MRAEANVVGVVPISQLIHGCTSRFFDHLVDRHRQDFRRHEAERLRRGRDCARRVYLVRSAEYQFCNCGVFSIHASRRSTCIEPTFGDHGGQYGQESEEEEGKEDSQEEKEVAVRRNLMHPDSA